MITQERLRELFEYNKDTGDLIWKVTRNHKAVKGDVAGYIRPCGYIRVKVDSVNYLAHRLVWLYINGSEPLDQIDHINRDRKDNRLSNLRESSNALNQRNKGKSKSNTSGTTGVYWNKATAKWLVTIASKYYGVFEDKEFAELVAEEVYSKLGFSPNHGV